MPTKYAIRDGCELVETADYKGEARAALKPVHWTTAHDWVRRGRVHMTGLWRDIDNRIRYAQSEPGC